MKTPVLELKSLYLMSWARYFDSPITPNIISPRSKTTVYFLKLQRLLEKEKIDPNKYIGFIFSFAETKPTPGSLCRQDYIDFYLYQNGKDYCD
jgi:hypothetical protein